MREPPRGSSFAPEDWAVLSRHWYPVARLIDISDQPYGARLLDVPLVIYRAGGVLVVARDICIHRGTPLTMGRVEGDEIVCAYHGFRYGPDGRCRAVPAHPNLPIPPKLKLLTFPAVERYGLLWTCLADDPPGAKAIAPFPAWDDADYQPILPPTVDIAGSAGRQMEGFLDVAHFAWVHVESFGDPEKPEVPSYKVTPSDGSLHVDYWSEVSNFPKGLQDRAPAGFRWLRAFDVYPPFAARLIVHFPDDGKLWILNAASPLSARQTRLFVPIARNFDKDLPVEDVYAFNARVFDEDRRFVEAQTPEDLPLDLTSEAHITADRTSIAYRRLLAGLGLGRGYTS